MKQNNNILSIIIGIFIISFLIWNRFIRIREPLKITDILSNNIVIFSVFCMFLVSLVVVIYMGRKILDIQPNKNSFLYKTLAKITATEYFVKIQEIYKEYITNAPRNFYEVLYKRVYIKPYVEKVGSYLVVYCTPYIVYIYFSTLVLPKVIVALIFLSELVYKQELNIFYKSLILLTIPLIVNMHLFVIKHLSNNNKIFIELHLDFHDTEDDYYRVTIKEIQPNIPNALNFKEIDLNIIVQLWYIYFSINNFMDTFAQVRDKYRSYEYLVIYLIYTLGWGYYLYLLLNNI